MLASSAELGACGAGVRQLSVQCSLHLHAHTCAAQSGPAVQVKRPDMHNRTWDLDAEMPRIARTRRRDEEKGEKGYDLALSPKRLASLAFQSPRSLSTPPSNGQRPTLVRARQAECETIQSQEMLRGNVISTPSPPPSVHMSAFPLPSAAPREPLPTCSPSPSTFW
jgi:hypothetical protein